MSYLVDIGANLTDEQFTGRRKHTTDETKAGSEEKKNDTGDLGDVLRRVHSDKIIVILTGTNINVTKKSLDIIREYPDNHLFTTVGYHPHNAKKWNKYASGDIIKLYNKNKDTILAVGECGLDYNRMFSPKEKQLYVFEQHIKLAIKLGLPMFCHEREASADFMKLTDKYATQLEDGGVKIVVHCFTGNSEEAKEYIRRGFYIGMTGYICNKKRCETTQRAFTDGSIPLNRLLIETDAPYMNPPQSKPDYVGKKLKNRNEPSKVKYVAQVISELCDVSYKKVVRTTTENAFTVFGFPDSLHDEIKAEDEKLPFIDNDKDFPTLFQASKQ
jgi:TatD DNase family protein